MRCLPDCVFLPLFATLLASGLEGQTYPYRVTDLGVVPGQNPIAGVGSKRIHRDGGLACGTSVWEPYVWRQASGMTALPKLAGFPNGEAFDVDGSGRVVGSCGLLTTGSAAITAVLWDALGNPTSLGRLNGSWSRALCVNDAGLVAGTAEAIVGGVRRTHAFTWSASSGIADLTPTAASSSIYDLNQRGQMLLNIDSAFLRRDPSGTSTNIGGYEPARLNEFGQVAGKFDSAGTLARYTDGLGWELLGAGAPFQLREIGGIDDLGQIVGTRFILQSSSPPSYRHEGYLWSDGLGLQRLDDLIDPALNITIRYAKDIAEDGSILASGSIGPDNRAMLLEPNYVSPYGSSCGNGPVLPRLGVAGVPSSGRRLALLSAGGVPSSTTFLAIGLATTALPLGNGCSLLVDLAQPSVFLPLPNNPIGQASLALDLPRIALPVQVHAQALHLDPAAPSGVFGVSAGLTIDLRP